MKKHISGLVFNVIIYIQINMKNKQKIMTGSMLAACLDFNSFHTLPGREAAALVLVRLPRIHRQTSTLEIGGMC